MRKEDHPWYRPRGYLHFDLPISQANAERLVPNPQVISKHAFYPLISYTIQTIKVKKDKSTGQLIRKKKPRAVSYASHIDSQIYSYYSYILSPLYEEILRKENISSAVLAFRKLHECNIHFASCAFSHIQEIGECLVSAYDVEKFFDNLDHQLLKNAWCRLLACDVLPEDHYKVFKSLTAFAHVSRDDLYKSLNISKHNPKNGRIRICSPSDFRNLVRKNGLVSVNHSAKGIPQGSPMSALLSNIYMLEFDQKIGQYIKTLGGNYLRYCDDILCIIPREHAAACDSLITAEIANLKLTINKDKTKTSNFIMTPQGLKCDRPLQYLGFMFDGQSITIRSAALARFSERMKRGVRLAKLTMIKHNKQRNQKGDPAEELYKRKLYKKYSHLGRKNFVRYGLKSADIMGSKAIKNQLKPLWNRLAHEIEKSRQS